jgi:hypothetical protein
MSKILLYNASPFKCNALEKIFVAESDLQIIICFLLN